MIGVGENAKPSWAEQVILDLGGNPEKNLEVVKAALANAFSSGHKQGFERGEGAEATVNEQCKVLEQEAVLLRERIATLEEENTLLRLRPELPSSPPVDNPGAADPGTPPQPPPDPGIPSSPVTPKG